MDISVGPAAKSALVMVVTSLCNTGSYKTQIYVNSCKAHLPLLCLEKLVPCVSGRLIVNEHRNMELESTPKDGCLANGDVLHVSEACLRSPGTGSLSC